MAQRDICERTFAFAVRIVQLCVALGERPGAPRRIGDQLLKAGTSIGANVEEAQAGQSRADFISKYSIALKEARETSYWSRLLNATSLEQPERLSELLKEVEELMKIIATIVYRAKQKN